MRYDYGLYILAILCFVLAVLIFMGYLTTGSEVSNLVTMMFSAILGIVFLALGYGVRPEKAMPPPEVPLPVSKPSTPPKPVTTKPRKEPKKKAVRKRRSRKKT